MPRPSPITKQKYLSIGFILAPILIFYALLARETVDLPFEDDYSGALGFLNVWTRVGTAHEKLLLIFTSQHNEYKLMFANASFAIQYLIFGHINFAVLSTFGNLLVVPLFLVVYRMWISDRRPIANRLLLFVPVAWLLFQFQYYSLLNWPMSSLQHIAVVLLSLLTIYLLSWDETRRFYCSLGSLFLAISASGNGFFVIPIGCLMLLQFRRKARLAYWLGFSGLMLAFYLYKYDFHRSQAHADGSIVSSVHHVSPLYALSFLGASIAGYRSYIPAAVLGGCLCLLYGYLILDKFYLKNPAIFYSIGFIIVTAVAVSGLRSDFGIAQSLVSRYRMYSNLLIAFSYLYFVGELERRWPRWPVRQMVFVAVFAVAAIGFNAGSDYAGFKLLRIRTDLTREGLRRWERGEQSITTAPGPANEDPVIRRQRLNGNYYPEEPFLRQAIDLHIYSLPPL